MLDPCKSLLWVRYGLMDDLYHLFFTGVGKSFSSLLTRYPISKSLPNPQLSQERLNILLWQFLGSICVSYITEIISHLSSIDTGVQPSHRHFDSDVEGEYFTGDLQKTTGVNGKSTLYYLVFSREVGE